MRVCVSAPICYRSRFCNTSIKNYDAPEQNMRNESVLLIVKTILKTKRLKSILRP